MLEAVILSSVLIAEELAGDEVSEPVSVLKVIDTLWGMDDIELEEEDMAGEELLKLLTKEEEELKARDPSLIAKAVSG